MTDIGYLVLPDRPHFPGQTPRPPEALFSELKRGIAAGAQVQALARSDCFRAGFAAFDARYYWEAHELWEPVWLALPSQRAEAFLVRGVIQLANAGLKHRMQRPGAASRITGLAEAALQEAGLRGRFPMMAIAQAVIERMKAQVASENTAL